MSVSNNISQPLCDSTRVTFDPTRPVPDSSQAVIKSNGAVSGVLEGGCDSADTISDSVVPAGLSEEICSSSHSASNPVVPIADCTASVSDSLSIASTNSQTSPEYPLAAKNVVSFLKKILKEEGALSTLVSRYQLSITEEGKLEVTCKECKKDVLVCDTKHSHVQNLDSREHQLQLAILENEQDYPASIAACFRKIDKSFPRTFLLIHKGAFCCVCSNTTISLTGQRNPFGNAKQHVESKSHKTKMHGSLIVSSKDI